MVKRIYKCTGSAFNSFTQHDENIFKYKELMLILTVYDSSKGITALEGQ